MFRMLAICTVLVAAGTAAARTLTPECTQSQECLELFRPIKGMLTGLNFTGLIDSDGHMNLDCSEDTLDGRVEPPTPLLGRSEFGVTFVIISLANVESIKSCLDNPDLITALDGCYENYFKRMEMIECSRLAILAGGGCSPRAAQKIQEAADAE